MSQGSRTVGVMSWSPLQLTIAAPAGAGGRARRWAADGQDRRARGVSWEAALRRPQVVAARQAQACDVPARYRRRCPQDELAAEPSSAVYDRSPGGNDASVKTSRAGSNGSASSTSGPTASDEIADASAFERLRRDLQEVGSQLRAVMQGAPSPEVARGQSVESLDGCLDALKQVEGATAAVKARLVACVAAARTHRETGHVDTGAYLRDKMRLSGREAKTHAEL